MKTKTCVETGLCPLASDGQVRVCRQAEQVRYETNANGEFSNSGLWTYLRGFLRRPVIEQCVRTDLLAEELERASSEASKGDSR